MILIDCTNLNGHIAMQDMAYFKCVKMEKKRHLKTSKGKTFATLLFKSLEERPFCILSNLL